MKPQSTRWQWKVLYHRAHYHCEEQCFHLGQRWFQNISLALICACNPRSQELDPKLNTQREQILIRKLQQRMIPWSRGWNSDPQGNYGENSFCIRGVNLAQARSLARFMGQNAFVFAKPKGQFRLIWL